MGAQSQTGDEAIRFRRHVIGHGRANHSMQPDASDMNSVIE
jgi:hypothetical protein